MKTVGLQVIDLESSFSLMVWPEISRTLNEWGYNVILFPGQTPFSPYEFERKSNTIYNYLNNKTIDLLILQTSTFQNFYPPQGLKELYSHLKSEFPVVSFGVEIPEFPSLIVENYSGMKESVLHLHKEHGMTRIGFVSGPPKSHEAVERLRGYTDGMKECGLSVPEEWILLGDFQARTGSLLMKRHFDLVTGEFEGLIFSNDDMALNAYTYLTSRGINIPEKLAIVGFDDMEDARINKVPLTTVKQPFVKMARAAAEMARDILEGKDVPLVTTFSTSFVIRSSCGCSSILRKKAYLEKYAESIENSSILKTFINDEVSSQLSDVHIEILMDIIRSISQVMIETEPTTESIIELLGLMDKKILNVSVRFPLVINWQNIISLIYTVTKRLSPYHILYAHNDFFQRAPILVGDRIAMEEGFFRLKQYDELTIPIRYLNYQLNSAINQDEINDILLDCIEQFQIENCFVSLFMAGERIPGIMRDMSARSQLVFAYKSGVQLHVSREDKFFPSETPLPSSVHLEEVAKTYMLGSLFFKAETLGVLFIEVCSRSPGVNENIRLYLSSALNNALLHQGRDLAELKLRSLLAEMEEHKTRQKRLSLLDPVTGILQKRGFIVHCSRRIDEIKVRGGSLAFVFIRVVGMDEFLQRNTVSQGDSERRHIASYLKKVFREDDYLSLLDKDTFIACLDNPGKETEDIITIRIKKLQENKFQKGNHQGFSFSLCFVNPGRKDLEKPLEQYLDQAEVQFFPQN